MPVSRNQQLKQATPSLDGYIFQKKIGQGLFGSVWLAYDIKAKANYAIKVLESSFTMMNEIDNEISAYKAGKDCIFVVDFIGSSFAGGRSFIVMELVQGRTLADCNMAKGGINWTCSDARIVVSEIAIALDYMHTRGISHSDLHSGNILLNDHGHVKLIDFGCA
ncbi:hypothetical protein CROQUDRAFT_36365, partial [Cronartium quercuum f. sp. fusiforme G11]